MSRADYQRVGWRPCPKCGVVGYAYRWKGRSYVKHPVPIQQAQQLTFTGQGIDMMQKKQSTCAISAIGRHFAIVTSVDHRLKTNKPIANLPTPKGKIAVFPGAV